MKILLFRTYPSVLDLKNYNSQELGLARAMVRAGHKCDIVYYAGESAFHTQEFDVYGCDDKVTVYWLPGKNFFKNGIFKNYEEIAKQYDIIQVSEYDQLQSRKLYRFWKKCPVTIYHGPYSSEFTKGYNLKCKIFDLIFNKSAANKNTVCFAKSGLAADFLRKKGFERVIPVGVGLDRDSLGAQYEVRPIRSVNEPFTILYIGVLEERRDIPLLLKTLARVKEKKPDVKLILVGKGEKTYVDMCFDQMTQLGIRENIEYIEKVSQCEVNKLYKRADVFVLPTHYEIFGMVLLEAMYFGVPVISGINGGSSVLIENESQGIVIPDFEAENWADAVLKLSDDPLYAHQIGINAHQRVERSFFWDGIAAAMIKEYTTLLGEQK